jgi:hypothetical protein
MFKVLSIMILSLYGTVVFSAPHFLLKNGIERKGGKAKILTPLAKLVFNNDALLLSGRKNELRLTLPDWQGESGSVIYDFLPVNWNGQSSQENVVFMQSLDGSDGNFTLYKYKSTKGIWLLTQARLSPGKFKNQFPIMDRKSLIDCRTGEWQQLALVWKSGEFVKAYLNGSLIGTASGTSFFPSKFTSISIGRNTGKETKYQTRIKNLNFERRPLSDTEIKLHYDRSRKIPVKSAETIIPLTTMTASKLDGNIFANEYPTRLPGLLDSSKNFELMSGHSLTAWGQDEQFIYLGAEVTIPENYSLRSAVSTRDDARQISKGDLFVFFMTSDLESDKAMSGAYFTLNASNNIYDAKESVDWGKSSCQRDATVNFGIRSVSKIKDGRWTVELAIPKKVAGEGDFRISMGFKINGVRYMLTPQTIWFDHYQGLARIVGSDIGVKNQYNGLDTGKIQQHFELSSGGKKTGNANFELSSADFQRSSEGMVLDQFIGEKVKILSGKSFDRQNNKFSISSEEPTKIEFATKMDNPDVYLLSSQITSRNKIVFQRQFMFRLFPEISVTIKPIPSQNKLSVHPLFFGDARKHLKNGRVRITLKRNGIVALTQELAASTATEITLSLDKLTAGNYKLETALLNKSGKLICCNSTDWTRPVTELWRKNRVGMAALSPEWCPEPWTPITQKGNIFSVWGRNYDWDGNTLLTQITSQKEKLFSAPIALKVQTENGEEAAVWSEIKIISTANGRVQLEKSGKLPGMQLKACYTLEFDGLVKVRILVKPDSASILKSLFLEFPFNNTPQMAVQSRTWWQVGRVRKEKWKNFPSMWFGNNKIGCNIVAESCRGWWIDSGLPRVEVLPTDTGASVRLLIVNKPGRLKHELDFSFLLQAGPLKPNFKDCQDFRLVGGSRPATGGNAFYVDPRFWSSSYSRPLPLNYKRFNDMVKTCHSSGHKVYCYLTPFAISTYDIIPRGTPVTKWSESLNRFVVWKKKESKPVKEYFYNAADWNLKPTRLTGDGVAGRETTEMAYLAPDSSWADFFAASVENMLRKSDFDGFYFDLPLPQENFDDTKNLSYTTRDGIKEGTVQLLAARNLYKRLYWLFAKYRAGRHPWIIGHHIRELYPINAFCDLELHGEGIKPKKAFDYTKTWLQPVVKGTPVAKISSGSSDITASGFSTAHGGTHSIPSIVLPQYGYSAKLNRDPQLARELLGWTLSKGALLWPVYIHSSTVTNFWQKLEKNWGGFRDAKFNEASQVGLQVSPGSLYGGIYRKNSGDDDLLVLFNPDNQIIGAKILLSEPYRTISDFETNQALPVGKNVDIKIPAHDFKILRLKR